jgi:ankyrin repeat protein
MVLVDAGCDVNQADNYGRTLAYIAAQAGHKAALELLVKAGCDVNQANKNGRTPASAAAYYGHTAALELLVNSYPADLQVADL